jgi:hypothetical protein
MSSLDRRYIQPEELRSWWHWIRPGLDKIKTKSTEPWIPEDVYADCYSQRSMLWVLFSLNKPIGFAVLQPVGDTLHVWCAFAYEDNHLLGGWEQIQEIAKAGNATKVTFDSNRRGWDKVARQMGFRPRKWVKELT